MLAFHAGKTFNLYGLAEGIVQFGQYLILKIRWEHRKNSVSLKEKIESC